MQIQTTCTNCEWTWYTNSKVCSKCHGSCYNEKETETTVNIPAWMNTWEYIKVPGMWNEWKNWGWEWDLYIKINIIWWQNFQRKWNHLILEINIDIYQAVLWWQTMVDHPEGKMKISIPKWLQVWEMINIAWRWFGKKWLFSSKWDFIIIPNIQIPKRLSKEDEKKWKELWSKK
jgi:DnaJ-class molecular chaperone